MEELTTHQFSRVADLFKPLDANLAVPFTLAGQAGRVFVDHASAPHCSLIWIQHRFYLAGDPERADFQRSLGQFFNETVFPAHSQDGFVIYFADPRWEGALTQAALPDHPPIPSPRAYYELESAVVDTPAWVDAAVPLPEGFTLQPVTRALTENRGFDNLDDLLEEMGSERPGVEEFLARSFGTCLLHENHIVTWVLSEYNLGERCEVGIATHPDYQRRGFAALTGRAFVEQARQLGMRRIGWHCWKNNIPSVRAALKIGFHNVEEAPTCMVFSDPLINLAVHGNVRFYREDYAGAAEWYDRAFAAGDLPGWACLNAACTQAMLGDPQKAFQHLYQAVDRGFADPRHLESVDCLNALKGTPEWAELIHKLNEQA
jgi:RimJ/RimL family protein N-acetyltransferase